MRYRLMAIIEGRFKSLYFSLFAVFVILGTSVTVVGATLPRIFSDFRWSYGSAGAVLAAFSIGAFLATYAAGRLLHRLGPKRTLALGLGLDALGLAVFAATPSVPANLLLYFAVGVGQGFIEVGVNWSILRMEVDGKGRAMSLIHGGFSAGAVAGPLVTGLLGATGLSWTLVYRGIALVFGLLALGMAALPFSRLGGDEGGKGEARRGLGKSPAYYLGFAALFLYVGTEIGISNWSAEYFVRVFGSSPETGAFMVSLFWAGLLAGRFGFPLLASLRQEALLKALALLMSVSVGLIVAAGAAGRPAFLLGVAAVGLAGLGASCIYPISMTLLGAAFPGAQGAAIGFASTGGGVGAFVFPFAMAAVSGRVGVLAGFGFYAATAVLSATASFALVAAVRRAQARRLAP